MKLRHLPMIAALSLFSAVTFAAGYTGPDGSMTATTVKTALDARDDTPVTLQGYIIKRLKGDHYEFQDVSGTIEVEIDDDEWPGTQINEKTQVKLYGEVDRHLGGAKVDVKRVELVQ